MQINDTAFPGPALIPSNTVSEGAVVRQGDNYLTLLAGGTWVDLTANAVISAPTGQVQPVTATLTISAPA